MELNITESWAQIPSFYCVTLDLLLNIPEFQGCFFLTDKMEYKYIQVDNVCNNIYHLLWYILHSI